MSRRTQGSFLLIGKVPGPLDRACNRACFICQVERFSYCSWIFFSVFAGYLYTYKLRICLLRALAPAFLYAVMSTTKSSGIETSSSPSELQVKEWNNSSPSSRAIASQTSRQSSVAFFTMAAWSFFHKLLNGTLSCELRGLLVTDGLIRFAILFIAELNPLVNSLPSDSVNKYTVFFFWSPAWATFRTGIRCWWFPERRRGQ